jgi:carboxypeptidase D
MDGAMMEIGPYRVREGGKLEYNDGSWDEFANVLFVDNPVGTGFSYVDSNSFLHELDEMKDDFITFLEKWFALFPEYEHDDVGVSKVRYGDRTDMVVDLYRRRIVCWPAHPVHRKGHHGTQQGFD